MSTRYISDSINDIYGIAVSAPMISAITDKIIAKALEWQNRALDTIYLIVFIDCVHFFNIKSDNMVSKKAAYIILRVNETEYKETLEIWIRARMKQLNFGYLLTLFKNRDVKDILILCSDGLTGIKQALSSVFSNTVEQRCIVNLIRNSCKYLSYKDRKPFCADLKTIYQASSEETARANLNKCKSKWQHKYPYAFRPWDDNWNKTCSMFNYIPEIRKIVYPTNDIESLNSAFRKFTKIRTVFPTEENLFKSLYLLKIILLKNGIFYIHIEM